METLLLLLLLILPGVAAADPPDTVILLSAPIVVPPYPLPLFFRTSRSDFLVQPNGAPPDLSGLRDLRVSGSGQFAPGQLPAIVEALRAHGAGHVTILDLRDEPHVMVDSACVAWLAPFNSLNWGRTAASIEADEERRASEVLGQGTLVVHFYVHGIQENPSLGLAQSRTLEVVSAGTERELVEGSGLAYARLACPDDLFPPPDQVDRFVRLVKSLPPDEWLHIHCAAGHTRTTTFMVLHDMMANAGRVSREDIVARQGLLGGDDLDRPHSRDPQVQLWAQEVRARTADFHDYCREQAPGFEIPWSQWLAARGRR